MNGVRAYFDSHDYSAVGVPGSLSPPDARAYFRDLAACPYCSGRLVLRQLDGYWTRQAEAAHAVMRKYEWTGLCYFLELANCLDKDCGWWALEQITTLATLFRDEVTITWGQIKNFDTVRFDEPLKLLREKVRRNQGRVRSPFDEPFEPRMVDCLTDTFPGGDAKLLGTSVDGLTQVYGVQADTPILVQVGLRKSGSVTTGPTAIQEIHGVRLKDGRYDGVVLTSTEPSVHSIPSIASRKQQAACSSVLKLQNYGDLLDCFRQDTEAYQPWERFIVRRT